MAVARGRLTQSPYRIAQPGTLNGLDELRQLQWLNEEEQSRLQ